MDEKEKTCLLPLFLPLFLGSAYLFPINPAGSSLKKPDYWME
jgi:hypothetical protein